jgi:hypothetical protein
MMADSFPSKQKVDRENGITDYKEVGLISKQRKSIAKEHTILSTAAQTN